MKVQNMTSNKTGKSVANQFIIEDEGRGSRGNFLLRQVFQSYNSVIAIKTRWPDVLRIELDKNKWDYSRTTGKYRNQFLGETKKETKRKIKDGTYKLVNLN
jgi:hypothetical protein